MSDQPPTSPHAMPSRRPGAPGLVAAAIGLLLILAVALGGVFWFVIRVEVNAGEILVLVNKTGKRIPEELTDEFGDQVVLYDELVQAISGLTGESTESVLAGYKGIRHQVLSEGRYFPNPYSYKAIKMKAFSI